MNKPNWFSVVFLLSTLFSIFDCFQFFFWQRRKDNESDARESQNRDPYLRTSPITPNAQGQTTLAASDVTEGSARVLNGLPWFEDDVDLKGGVGPDVAFYWLNLDDIIIEQHGVSLHNLYHTNKKTVSQQNPQWKTILMKTILMRHRPSLKTTAAAAFPSLFPCQ